MLLEKREDAGGALDMVGMLLGEVGEGGADAARCCKPAWARG